MADPNSTRLQLRPHQADSRQMLRAGLRQGLTRQVLYGPTGMGKTETAIHIIQEALTRDSRVLFICDRIILVEQTHRRLAQYGIPHGVIMSNQSHGQRQKVLVCSAQTIEQPKYEYLWRDLDLAIIDECHTMRAKILQLALVWGGPVIGLSATPFTDGLADFYQGIQNPISTDALLASGWLAPLRVYPAVPMEMPMINDGEWTADQVRTSGRRIIGNIVSTWAKMTTEHFGGPVKTLVFSADVAHGEELCQAFQLAGYDFRQSTHRDSFEVTKTMVKEFEQGRFHGLVSVEKFCKGFDVPDVLCMVGARPYRTSLASVIQQLGRGMRTAPGKEYALYIDHAENMVGWYEEVSEIWANGVPRLPDTKRKTQTRREGDQREDVICNGCQMVIPPGSQGSCLYCGRPRSRRRTQRVTVEGRVGDELTRPGSRDWAEDRRWTWRQMCRVALDRKGGDEEAGNKLALAQFKNLYDDWPPRDWGFDPVEGKADGRVERKVRQQLQAYYKRKGE